MFKRWLTMSVWAPDGGAAGGAVDATPGVAAGAADDATVAGGAAGGPPPSPAVPPKGFADTLPADIRDSALFRDIKDLDGLARSYVNAGKMVGLDKGRIIALPAEGDDAAWNEVYAKLGRPEAPDKYGFKAPDGVAVDAKLQESFSKTAHDLGLNTAQATKLYEWWNGQSAAARTALAGADAAKLTEAEAALKTEWGTAYDQRLDLAKKAVAHYGGADLVAELEKTGLGNSPKLANLLAKLGQGLSEDGLIGKAPGGGGDTLNSPTEARQQIAAKNNDPAFMKSYLDKAAPGHKEAVASMAQLYEQAYPTAA